MTPDANRNGSGERRTGTRERTATRRGVLRATGAGVAGVALGGVAGTAAADEGVPSRLHTDGKWVRDADGEAVRLRGLATASMGFYEVEGNHPKTPTEVVDWASDPARGWYPNVVRLPVTKWDVDQLGVDALVSDVLRPVVDLLGERGTYAMIDFHLIHPYTEAAADDADYGTSPDELVRNFWGGVAPAFADDEHVIYELFNEPTYPIFWSDNGESVESPEDEWLLWRDTAQPWVDMVREEAPETPIVLGSPSWTSRTNFAPEYPFEGENLVYAAHIYPDNGQPDEFDDTYGAPAEDVPVFVTEFGWDPYSEDLDYGTNTDWGQPFREWVESYDNMGWAAWCFDDSWAPTMFDSPGEGGADDWTLRSAPEEHGGFIRQWLAESSAEPIARLVPDRTQATAGDWVHFEASDASGADRHVSTLEWDLGNGTTGDGWWADAQYDDPGQYEVELTATNDAGESTTHGLAITVTEQTEAVATAEPSTTEPAVGDTVKFEARDTSGDDRWIDALAWDFGDGTTAEGWWASHSYDSAGTYTVELTATDNAGQTTTDTVEIVVE
ncbi:PKD domain-containing protein [Halosimplex pelagicum]|uniref:Cellulase family glycosylhydrolase n=1 Tax=Halosimplex pelagicum TaxID=869886 RepID=A0A7D5P8V5_9EURY|nr:PKD domain-containing protein [Halosimplex pelagicum]QLH81664.1 cellulase family glycosylhydrolase [Halosimplex pelagicum]